MSLETILLFCIIGFILLTIFADPIKYSEKKLQHYLLKKGFKDFEILKPKDSQEIPQKIKHLPNHYASIPFKGIAIGLRDSLYRKIKFDSKGQTDRIVWVRIDTLFFYKSKFTFSQDLESELA